MDDTSPLTHSSMLDLQGNSKAIKAIWLLPPIAAIIEYFESWMLFDRQQIQRDAWSSGLGCQ
jgi:hypothetical protein